VNGYHIAEIDALLDKASSSIDAQERVNLVGQIQKIVFDQKPFISSYALPGLEASQGVDGYKGWPYNYPRLWNVWVTNKK
jgi:ABC-type transport system substrate-binding protein